MTRDGGRDQVQRAEERHRPHAEQPRQAGLQRGEPGRGQEEEPEDVPAERQRGVPQFQESGQNTGDQHACRNDLCEARGDSRVSADAVSDNQQLPAALR
ncbi:hypothetical protein [Amycolatopsis regifaucium]|uniref:Uncharacterized protein n=1 Tax=Amycolatopsis regifaucium TaxID=546365 RepID=A0A154M790_9PSEU|nr:hypothetical protein [Amycolatopsis regifaucium]KZB80406.1 hypothetical protein AVL48_12980 [Amycolatopsis regifaucium]OKA05376.1 hypothetical protein ATP06_0226805 [Amycolatopsis regifaucium]